MGKRADRDGNGTSKGTEAGRIEPTFGNETEQLGSPYRYLLHPLFAGNLPMAPAVRSYDSQTPGPPQPCQEQASGAQK